MKKLVIYSTIISNVLSILAGLCLDFLYCCANIGLYHWVTVVKTSDLLLAFGLGYIVTMFICGIIVCPVVLLVAVCDKE